MLLGNYLSATLKPYQAKKKKGSPRLAWRIVHSRRCTPVAFLISPLCPTSVYAMGLRNGLLSGSEASSPAILRAAGSGSESSESNES